MKREEIINLVNDIRVIRNDTKKIYDDLYQLESDLYKIFENYNSEEEISKMVDELNESRINRRDS